MRQRVVSLRGRVRDDARAQLLTALRDHPRASRTELGRLSGLPKSTIAALLHELIAEGLVIEAPGSAGGSGSGSGRPAATLTVAPITGMIAGIDFGHRHVRVALADGSQRILAEDMIELDVDHRAAEALDSAGHLLSRLLERTGTSVTDIRAAAAGIPGPIDEATKTVQSSTILASWVGVDPQAELRRRTGLEVLVDNDANLGALGEMVHGAARGCRDFIYVKVSNGIGACLMLDGKVYRGRGAAGEIGHTQLEPNGEWCRCGNRGCLEAVVSVDAVQRQLAAHGIDPLDADGIVHPVALKVLAESGRIVGRALANLCHALDPEAVILGGDLSATGTAFVDGVRESIERLAQPTDHGVVPVRPARLARRAELCGALVAAEAAAHDTIRC